MRTGKLVRDRVPEIIEQEGRKPIVKQLNGAELKQALLDKLADLVEVALALAAGMGLNCQSLFQLMDKKSKQRGGFDMGYYYEGDKQ